MPAYPAQTDQLAMFAQHAFRVIEKNVRFQCAMLGDPEAKLPEIPADLCEIGAKAQLDFDFDFQSDTLYYSIRKHRAKRILARLSRDSRHVSSPLRFGPVAWAERTAWPENE